MNRHEVATDRRVNKKALAVVAAMAVAISACADEPEKAAKLPRVESPAITATETSSLDCAVYPGEEQLWGYEALPNGAVPVLAEALGVPNESVKGVIGAVECDPGELVSARDAESLKIFADVDLTRIEANKDRSTCLVIGVLSIDPYELDDTFSNFVVFCNDMELQEFN